MTSAIRIKSGSINWAMMGACDTIHQVRFGALHHNTAETFPWRRVPVPLHVYVLPHMQYRHMWPTSVTECS